MPVTTRSKSSLLAKTSSNVNPSESLSPPSPSTEDHEDRIEDLNVPCTPSNVRDVYDIIFEATFTQQVARRWEQLEMMRTNTKIEWDAKHRFFTIRRGHNSFALVAPFANKKQFKKPVHMELSFPPTEEQLSYIERAFDNPKLANDLKDEEIFEYILSNFEYKGDDDSRSALEQLAYLGAHVPGYKRGKKNMDMKKTLNIVRKLRPAPSPVSPESVFEYSSTTPEIVQDFRRRSEKKEAAAQMDGATLWAAPERRGLRVIGLRKMEEEEETGTNKRRTVKRRKLEFE